MKELIIIRGVPGCGKSTLAQSLEPIFCFEADKYFENEDGKYIFDISKLKQAHNWCQNRVEFVMNAPNGYPPSRIVISNTFTTQKEMDPYFKLAEKYGYQVHVLVKENYHNGKDIHNVPEDNLIKMEKRLRDSIKLR